jgi:hypothetical protein
MFGLVWTHGCNLVYCACNLITLHVFVMMWMANMLCFLKNNHATLDIYMIMRHAYIARLVYTCYVDDEHAFNAMICIDMMYVA